MDIFLVRHGEAAAAWGQGPDPGLSELGVQQAAAAAELLLPQLSSEVQLISSPLKRAQETASPLARALALPVSIDNTFREIPAPVALVDRKTWLRGFMQQRWSEQPDTLVQWRNEALAQLRALQSPSVIFTHFLVLNAIVGAIKAQTETLCFWPDNASITHLQLKRDGSLQLLKLGVQMDTVVN